MTTSAKIPILALVVAMMLLATSGCGGGDDSEGETPSTSTTATAEAGAEGGAAAQGAGGTAPGAKDVRSSGTGSSGSASSPGSGPVGKQGSKVPVPKAEPEPGLTPEQRQGATVASIELSSPAVKPATGGSTISSTSTLPATYTCDGKNIWPEIRWQGVPADTAELVLFAMSLKLVESKLFFDWAVAGLGPALEGIDAGRLPRGAVVGRNDFGRVGYSICPVAGERETYFFALYALTERMNPQMGFDPHDLRKRVLEASGNGGLMAVSYARR